MRSFILKKRSEPLIIEGLSAAIQRLKWKDERLQSNYLARKAGFRGEQRLDYVFENYAFQMNYRVYPDLSLTSSTHFQIDTLLITPSYAVVFEVKSISGALKILKEPPLLQQTIEKSGKVNYYNSPVTQVKNNCELLLDWFYSRNIVLPVYGVIVSAYPKQQIELHDTSVPFLFLEGVPSYIRNLPTTPPILDENEFEQITSELLAYHKEYIPEPICVIYPELTKDIKPGVFCPFCRESIMKRYHGGWSCLSCNKKSPDAHKQAIRDWFLLFGGEMKNKECRDFLCIENGQMAYRLLKSMDLEICGAKRNRSYRINYYNDK